jgi:hypothetical protein
MPRKLKTIFSSYTIASLASACLTSSKKIFSTCMNASLAKFGTHAAASLVKVLRG